MGTFIRDIRVYFCSTFAKSLEGQDRPFQTTATYGLATVTENQTLDHLDSTLSSVISIIERLFIKKKQQTWELETQKNMTCQKNPIKI